MLRIEQIKGVIFDVDDTLLDNGTIPDPTVGLHARSRLEAVHTVGKKYDITELQIVTPVENVQAHMTAKSHTLPGTVWNLLFRTGLVNTETIDPANKLFQEIVAEKTKLHEIVLRNHGKEIDNATRFIRTLDAYGLGNKLAIASSAIRPEIDIFLEMTHLDQFFPDNHIISLESVTRFKPDPQCFELAFQSLEVAEHDRLLVIAFEDDPRGIQSAKDAGLYVCGINTRFQKTPEILVEAGADFVANGYAEFALAMAMPLIK